MQNQVCKNLAGGRGVHDSVPAEAIRQEEAGDACDGAKHAVMIGRHLIESSPRALGIDWKILKCRHAVRGMDQYFFNKRWLELSFVAGPFLRIVPGQQEASPFRTEVEAGAHVDDHG